MFGDLLKKHRERAKISQASLARSARVNPSLISRLESNDREPANRELVMQLGGALHLTLAEKNELLRSANYATISIDDVANARPEVRLLADLIDDRRVPRDEIQLVRLQLEMLQKRYRAANSYTESEESQTAEGSQD